MKASVAFDVSHHLVFELLRLIEKAPEHNKTLDERYRDIVDILRRPKYEELMQKYRDQLMKQVSIIYL